MSTRSVQQQAPQDSCPRILPSKTHRKIDYVSLGLQTRPDWSRFHWWWRHTREQVCYAVQLEDKRVGLIVCLPSLLHSLRPTKRDEVTLAHAALLTDCQSPLVHKPAEADIGAWHVVKENYKQLKALLD